VGFGWRQVIMISKNEKHVKGMPRTNRRASHKVLSRKTATHMTTYRINTIGRDGRFSGTKAVECVDDEEAVAKGQPADGDDVLIWEHTRFVARLPGRLWASSKTW
jgi:hypothetical protein